MTKVVDVIGYTSVISTEFVTQWGRTKAYARNVSAIGDHGHVFASVTVYGLGDGLDKRDLVHGDCLDAIGDGGRRAGGGGVGAGLDRTALRSVMKVVRETNDVVQRGGGEILTWPRRKRRCSQGRRGTSS